MLILETEPSEVSSVNVSLQNAVIGKKMVHYSPQVWLEGDDAKALQEGQTVTLINWGNVIIKSIERFIIIFI